MFRKLLNYLIVFLCFILSGCQTVTPPPKAENETYKDVGMAVESVAEAISGQELTQEDLRRLSKDPDAQSAIEAIVQPTNVVIKYCPINGKRYSAETLRCPIHDIELEVLQ